MDKMVCPLCEKVISKNSIFQHGTAIHKFTTKDECNFHILKKERIFKCALCDESFCTKKSLTNHINKEHGILSKTQNIRKNASSKRVIECKICGKMVGRLNHLSRHIKLDHPETNIEEYYIKYILKTNIMPTCKQCGGKVNFIFAKGFNDFCGFSCSTTWYAKNTNRIETAMSTIKEKKKLDPNFQLNPVHINYWTNKGYSTEEAYKKVSERQKTFSLTTCIEKYGEDGGLERWKLRQKTWIKNTVKRSYSIISQKLFWNIYDFFKNEKCITMFFAQNDKGVKIENGKNFEFAIETSSSYCKLDFYIPELNYCIEFDGDYWHGEKRGNKERDAAREYEIKLKNKNIIIIRVKECDYKKNPNKILTDLVDDIKQRIDEKIRSTI